MVAESTLVVAIASVGGTVATILTIASLWVWRHTTALHDEDVEKIEALREAEWQRAGAELADFFVDVVAEMDLTVDVGIDDLRAEFERFVVREMDEARVNRLVDSLQTVGRGRGLHRSHRNGYKAAYVYFTVALLLTMADVLLGIVHVVDVLPGTDSELVVVGIGFAAVVAVLQGILAFRTGRQMKEEFVDAWESARLED